MTQWEVDSMSCIKTRELILIGAVAFVSAAVTQAQTLGWFDFEASVPDELPVGPDHYFLQNIGDPPTGLLIRAAQDGAMFDDPIGPDGNKSAVWDNNDHIPGLPDGPTNATMGFGAGVWDADASQFTHGSVAYDIYLEPAPVDGLTFMENRLGFATQDGFISTVNDTTVRFGLGDGSGGPFIRYDGLGNLPGSPAPLVGATNHIRIDILPDKTHTITLNGTIVQWETPGGMVTALPWVDPAATGVNEMAFVADFQPEPASPHGLVWIDNVHIERIPEPGTVVLCLVAMGLVGIRRRRGKQ
jgi:hypothetical protein